MDAAEAAVAWTVPIEELLADMVAKSVSLDSRVEVPPRIAVTRSRPRKGLIMPEADMGDAGQHLATSFRHLVRREKETRKVYTQQLKSSRTQMKRLEPAVMTMVGPTQVVPLNIKTRDGTTVQHALRRQKTTSRTQLSIKLLTERLTTWIPGILPPDLCNVLIPINDTARIDQALAAIPARVFSELATVARRELRILQNTSMVSHSDTLVLSSFA